MASIPELESLRDGLRAAADAASTSNLDAANAYADAARRVSRLLPDKDTVEVPIRATPPVIDYPKSTEPPDSVDALPPEANKVLQELEAMEAPKPRKRIRKPKGV